ncbi:MAG: CoB--CoM heterodisulfide reductase iron-sulfur subunit B family protein [Anaerolineales bacterium]|nr:MAG: CoB--CoM heterodisulfide reductase iron-sulfur subunit B family protein [Anaerolineales bacterium]
MRYAYYPGCSLERSAASYHTSAMKVADRLGLVFQEVDDWNCCGATEYFAINLLPAYALVARNLALVPGDLAQMAVPCSACYVNLKKTDKYMGKYPQLAQRVGQSLAAGQLGYRPGGVQVRHLLDIIVNDVGCDAITKGVVKPLTGLRVAPYYGCLIVRPENGFDNPEYPTSMDRLLRALGAKVVDYPLKAQCCGGHMTQISEKVAYELIRRLLHNAAEYDADVIACVCPMCQLNLDAYQGNVNRHFGTDYRIPILYFTQLMALALGLSAADAGLGSEIVSAQPALAKIAVEVPQEEDKKARKRADKRALPMPTMPDEEA